MGPPQARWPVLSTRREGALLAGRAIEIPLRELRFQFSRSGGVGGQNVNKRSTRATLRWKLSTSRHLPDEVRTRLMARHGRRITAAGELILSSQRFRDQGRNVADCLERLRSMLADAEPPPRRRRPTRPTRASAERRLREKHQRGETKRRRRTTDE